MIKKVSKESINLVQKKITQLKKLFPEILTEDRLDFDKLKLVLGKEINEKDEKYSFNWAGRKESFKNIQTTAKGTLKPVEKESVNWNSTENLFIEGDNLEVLKLLQKSYFNQIKMIYIDPPYNTGKDFVYKDNFHNSIKSYLEQTGQLNGDGIKLTTNPETNGRFHSDWISMMYPRLFIARNLLKENGIMFISIDDNEVHNLRMILNEIFGEENFVSQLIWKKSNGKNDAKQIRVVTEYVLIYCKDVNSIIFANEELNPEYVAKMYKNVDKDSRGRWRSAQLYMSKNPKSYEIVSPTNKKWIKPWNYSEESMKKLIADNRVYWGKDGNSIPQKKIFLSENNGAKMNSLLNTKVVGDNQVATAEMLKIFPTKVFTYAKPSKLIKKLISLHPDKNVKVLDFFAGSGTTAHAVLDLNKEDNGTRKFICIQLPEKVEGKSEAFKAGFKTITDIAKERIKIVINESHPNQGFKVFKLEKSNYKIWEKYEGKDGKELKEQLELFKTPLRAGYKNENVIFECIIKEGYSLNSKIEKFEIKSNNIYKVTDEELSFYICLDREIKDKTVDELKLKKDSIFICLDDALDDSKKKNLSIQCNLKVI